MVANLQATCCVALLLLSTAFLPAEAITPALPPPPDLSETAEARRDRFNKLALIPFVQLEVVAGHDERLADQFLLQRCSIDAVVRRSFRHADVLPVGRQIRVRLNCVSKREPKSIETEPGVWVDVDAAPLIEDLQAGALLQMRLVSIRGPQNAAFAKVGEVVVVPALSRRPYPDAEGMAQRVRHLNDYGQLDDWIRPNRHVPPPGVGNPPVFPTRDATLTYRHSNRPHELFQAHYHASTWRMRIDAPGDSMDREAPDVLLDALMQTRTQIWDQDGTYARQQTDWRERFGTIASAWNPAFEVEGSDIVAGLPCTRYTVRSGVHASYTVARVCLTVDGVPLRREDKDGTIEATRVEYRPVDPSLVALPKTYRPR